jgi:GntR family transcriptional regulator
VTIDRHDDRALYLQLADILRRDIADGRLGPGDKLPSESELIAQHGISRGTAREAITALRTEGIIIVEHGRGAYVRQADATLHTRVTSSADTLLPLREAFQRDVTEQGRTATTRTIDPAIITYGSDLPLPDGLTGPEGFLFFVDGRPVQAAAVWTGRRSRSLKRFLVEQITASMPARPLRRLLQIDDGTPVLHTTRILSQGSRQIEHAITVAATDRQTLSYHLS